MIVLLARWALEAIAELRWMVRKGQQVRREWGAWEREGS